MYRLDKSKKKWDAFRDLNLEACIITILVLLFIIGGVLFVASTPNSNYPVNLIFIHAIS